MKYEMPESTPTVKLYVELTIGMGAFGAFLYFMNLHVTTAGVTVPQWMFIALLAIMGATLGLDILAQYRGNS